MSGRDSNIQPGQRKLPKMLTREEQERSRSMPANENEIYGLKKDIDAGCQRFWAKRGGDENKETSFNYGGKKKKFK